MKKASVIHSPDLLYFQWCQSQFGINRGVYNTIDLWFFQNGIMDILERRKIIQHFLLLWIRDQPGKNPGKVKIGHGNLSKKLNDYLGSGVLSNDHTGLEDLYIN